MPTKISNEELEELVGQAVDGLPDEIVKSMENLAILVRDEPDDDLAEMALRDESLAEVLPVMYLAGSTRSFQAMPSAYLGHRPVRPDILVFFRELLEAECDSRDELISTVERGLRRELGRYFGMSEEKLEELGWA